MYAWITLLYSGNWHNNINQLYFDTKKKKRGEGSVTLEAEPGVMQPQTKKGWQPPETGRDKNTFSP